MRQNHRAPFAEALVAAGMVAMPMRVDHEADRIRIDGAHRGENLVGQRRELVVHQRISVLAIGQADIAAGSEQHGHAGRDALHLDLDLGEILLRSRARGHGEQGCGECESDAAHVRFLLGPFGPVPNSYPFVPSEVEGRS
jgi:hypothetical protein